MTARPGGPRPEPGRAGRIALSRAGRRVDVVVDGIPYSTFHPDRPWSGYAWDALAAASAWVESPRPSILLLGAGAGTVLVLLRRLLPGADMTAVELDPRIVEMGRQRGMDEIGAEIVIGDALEYVATTRRRFDLILDDLFMPRDGGLGRPVDDEEAHLRRIASRLRPAGVAATNVTTDGDPPALERTVARAYKAVFPHRLKLTPRRGYNAIHAGSTAEMAPARLRVRAETAAPDDAQGLLGTSVRRAS